MCQTKATCKTQQAIWKLAVQNGKLTPCLQLFSTHSESDIWHAGLPAAGLIRPSVPWCFGAAAPSLDPRCARRKPPARHSKQFGSWQCRTAGQVQVCSYFLSIQKVTFGTLGCRPRVWSVLQCHCVLVLRHHPWIRGVPDESHLQDAASNLEAGSAERQVKARFAAIF